MTQETFKWFQNISINLGVAGALFFLLFVGWVPSPVVTKLDAQAVSTAEVNRSLHQLNRTVKVLCILTAKQQNADPLLCYNAPLKGNDPSASGLE